METEEQRGDESTGPKLSATGPIPSATRVDLKVGIIRAGLGPMELESLQLEPEDIGLKQPVVIMDVLSPKPTTGFGNSSKRPLQLDTIISQDQIDACRRKIQAIDPAKNIQVDQCKGKELIIWQPREKEKNLKVQDYIVEFPEEVENTTNEGDAEDKEGGDGGIEEKTLSATLSMNLSLKRQWEEGIEEGWKSQKRIKGNQGCKTVASEQGHERVGGRKMEIVQWR